MQSRPPSLFLTIEVDRERFDGERYRSEGRTGYADEDGTGDGDSQTDAAGERCRAQGHHREVDRRSEIDEGGCEHELPDDQ
jgi:hypothetical protein